jgi:two-component system sensor histidine kinase UhpB
MGTTLQRISRRSTVQRVVVANALIIFVGAVIGTWLTRAAADQPIWLLALIFFAAGVTSTAIVNYTLLRGLIRPLLDVVGIMRSRHKGQGGGIDLDNVDDPNLRALAEALSEMLLRLEGESRHYSSRLLNSIEEERRRIGRELHDETSQTLAATLINLEIAEKGLRNSPVEVRERVARCKQLLAHSLEQIKLLIYDLRPSTLDDLGLVPALRWYIESHLRSAGLTADTDFESATVRLPGEVETALYRVAQEALANVVKHSGATHVAIKLETHEGYGSLAIIDNGRGFDKLTVAPGGDNPHGVGLLSMQERVELLGGQMTIDTEWGRGTRVHAVVPVHEGRERGQR